MSDESNPYESPEPVAEQDDERQSPDFGVRSVSAFCAGMAWLATFHSYVRQSTGLLALALILGLLGGGISLHATRRAPLLLFFNALPVVFAWFVWFMWLT